MKNDSQEVSMDHLQQGIQVSPFSAAIAGSISGLVARTVIAPLDIIKIRLQLSPDTTTITKTCASIWRNEGVWAFWKGNVPLSVMYIIYGSSQFAAYAAANSTLSQIEEVSGSRKLNSNVHSLIVGSIAGMSSTLLSYPFDLLRTRLALNELHKFDKLGKVAGQVWHDGKLLGFYRGLKPSLVSVTLQTGIMFQSYEFTKELVRSNQDSKVMKALDPMSGLISGLIAKAVVFPLDLIRKRLQMTTAHDQVSMTSFQIMKQIVARQGVRGLFSGLTPLLLKSGPTSAVSLWMYEWSVRLLDKIQF